MIVASVSPIKEDDPSKDRHRLLIYFQIRFGPGLKT